MRVSRRGLFATAGAIAAAAGLKPACAHDWVSVGAVGRGNGNYLICRACRIERVQAMPFLVGDKRPDGLLTPREYQRHYGGLPTRAAIERAIEAHL